MIRSSGKPTKQLRIDLVYEYNNHMKIDISHIAKLANLPLSKEEEKKFEKQLKETLTYIEKLQRVRTENVAPTDQVTGLENVSQEDKTTSSISQEEVLANAKSTHNGLFKVPAILEK